MGPMQQPGSVPPPQQPQDPELQQLLDALGLTEADLEALFESGVFEQRMGMLPDMNPQMRQAGRVNVASSPLEMVAAGLGRAKGNSLIDLLKKGNRVGGIMSMRDRYGSVESTEPEDKVPEYLRRPDWQG